MSLWWPFVTRPGVFAHRRVLLRHRTNSCINFFHNYTFRFSRKSPTLQSVIVINDLSLSYIMNDNFIFFRGRNGYYWDPHCGINKLATREIKVELSNRNGI